MEKEKIEYFQKGFSEFTNCYRLCMFCACFEVDGIEDECSLGFKPWKQADCKFFQEKAE